MPQNAQNYSALISSKAQREQTERQLKQISLSQLAARQNRESNSNSCKPDAAFDCPDVHLNTVMSDLNRLSKSFVNSYQNLEGQVEQLSGQLQDVNEQRSEAIEEKQAMADRLQHLLAILPSGVVVLDGNGIVRDCNAVAIDVLGRPLLGESWLNVINRAFMPQADDGHQISLKDGRKVHIETRALDSEPGQMIVLTDMTKTRELQSELSQQQKLSSMGTMIASLAHQLRTPLAAAILYGSHLNGKKLSGNKKQEFSHQLMERLRFMDRQIADMLSFVKGEKKQKSYFMIKTLIQTIKSNCNAFSHPVEFEIDSTNFKNTMMLGDADALVGAINNLVANAIEASENKVPVVISITSSQSQRMIVEVTDRGAGICKNDHKKLFEPFYSTKANGNGLGLAIVQAIVVEHGGIIQVDSDINKGSRFTVDLPLCSVEPHRLTKQISMSQNSLPKEKFYTPINNQEAGKNTSQESRYDY